MVISTAIKNYLHDDHVVSIQNKTFKVSNVAGYKSESPHNSTLTTDNNVSSILAGHGDGPITSEATMSLAECTFPLR